MAKKEKEPTIIEYHRAFLVQLERNLDLFIGKCQRLDDEDLKAFEELRSYVTEFVGDVHHYINNYKMTDGIVNVNKDGKPALRGNQQLAKEHDFFNSHARQTDTTKTRPFISYKEFAKKIWDENIRRAKNGEELLADIASITYTSWKKKYK
jgi:hemerythrin-like domain-containing protein